MRKFAAHDIIWQGKHYKLSIAEIENNEVLRVYPLLSEEAYVEWIDGVLDLDSHNWFAINKLM